MKSAHNKIKNKKKKSSTGSAMTCVESSTKIKLVINKDVEKIAGRIP
jgi:hypothetical protein